MKPKHRSFFAPATTTTSTAAAASRRFFPKTIGNGKRTTTLTDHDNAVASKTAFRNRPDFLSTLDDDDQEQQQQHAIENLDCSTIEVEEDYAPREGEGERANDDDEESFNPEEEEEVQEQEDTDDAEYEDSKAAPRTKKPRRQRASRAYAPGRERQRDSGTAKGVERSKSNHKRRCDMFPPRTLVDAEKEQIRLDTQRMLDEDPFVKNMDVVRRFNIGYLQAMSIISKCDRSKVLQARKTITEAHVEAIRTAIEADPLASLEEVCERLHLPMSRVKSIKTHYLGDMKKAKLMMEAKLLIRSQKRFIRLKQDAGVSLPGNTAAAASSSTNFSAKRKGCEIAADEIAFNFTDADDAITGSNAAAVAVDEEDDDDDGSPILGGPSSKRYYEQIDSGFTPFDPHIPSPYPARILCDLIRYWMENPRASIQEATDALRPLRYTQVQHATKRLLKLKCTRGLGTQCSVHHVPDHLARHADIYIHATKYNNLMAEQRANSAFPNGGDASLLLKCSSTATAPTAADEATSSDSTNMLAQFDAIAQWQQQQQEEEEAEEERQESLLKDADKSSEDSEDDENAAAAEVSMSSSASRSSTIAAVPATSAVNLDILAAANPAYVGLKPAKVAALVRKAALRRIGMPKAAHVAVDEDTKRKHSQKIHAVNYKRRREQFPARQYEEGEFEYIIEETQRMINEGGKVKNMDVVQRFGIGYIQAMRILSKCDRKAVRETHKTEMQSQVAQIKELLTQDPFLTQEKVCEMLNIPTARARHIILFYLKGLTAWRDGLPKPPQPPPPEAAAAEQPEKKKTKAEKIAERVPRYNLVHYYPFELAMALKAEIGREASKSVHELAEALMCDVRHIRNALISAPGLRVRKPPGHHNWHVLPSAPFDLELEQRVLEEWFLYTLKLMVGEVVLDPADIADGELDRRLSQHGWPAHLNAEEHAAILRVIQRGYDRAQLADEREQEKNSSYDRVFVVGRPKVIGGILVDGKYIRRRPLPPLTEVEKQQITFHKKMMHARGKFDEAMQAMRARYAEWRPFPTAMPQFEWLSIDGNKDFNFDNVLVPRSQQPKQKVEKPLLTEKDRLCLRREKRNAAQERKKNLLLAAGVSLHAIKFLPKAAVHNISVEQSSCLAKAELERSVEHAGCLELVFSKANAEPANKKARFDNDEERNSTSGSSKASSPDANGDKQRIIVRPYIDRASMKLLSDEELVSTASATATDAELLNKIFADDENTTKALIEVVKFDLRTDCAHSAKEQQANGDEQSSTTGHVVNVKREDGTLIATNATTGGGAASRKRNSVAAANGCCACEKLLAKATQTMKSLVVHGGEAFVKMIFSSDGN